MKPRTVVLTLVLVAVSPSLSHRTPEEYAIGGELPLLPLNFPVHPYHPPPLTAMHNNAAFFRDRNFAFRISFYLARV
jgi:hypothetical protein